MLISFGFMTPNANSFIFSSKKKNEDVHINEIWSKFNSGPHYELNKIVYLDDKFSKEKNIRDILIEYLIKKLNNDQISF